MLSFLALIFLLVAGLASLFFNIWLIVEAFKVSIVWGLVALFIPFGLLIFAVLHWDRVGHIFLGVLCSGVFSFIAAMMAGVAG